MVLVQRNMVHNQISNNSWWISLVILFLLKASSCHTSQFQRNNMINNTKQIILTRVLIKPKSKKSKRQKPKFEINVNKSEVLI